MAKSNGIGCNSCNNTANAPDSVFIYKMGTHKHVSPLNSLSRRELNPGPMTVPLAFYVRSLLAIWQFVFLKHRRKPRFAGIVTVKVLYMP